VSQRDQLLKVVEQDVHDDLTGFARLYEWMGRLQVALMARETVTIAEANGHIAALMDAASARARRRSRVLEVFRLGADTRAMESLIGLYEPVRRGHLDQAWKTLIASVERCRDLNERNGKLLAMHSEIFQQLARQDTAQVYSPSL
jgi:flagella synthesis protein FlgN